MSKYRINLVTTTDCHDFVKSVTECPHDVYLTDGGGFRVSGKSFLGALASVEWGELYCESEGDIYRYIQKFCI